MAPQFTATNGPVASRAALVNQAGHELLAGAGLAADVDRGLAARHTPDHLAQLLHDGGAAQQSRAAQRGGRLLVDGGAELDRAPDELAQHAKVQRLRDEIERTELQSARTADSTLPCAVITATGTVGAVLLNPGDQIEPVAIRQPHVGEAQVEAFGLQQLACSNQVGCGAGPQVHAAQGEAHELQQVGLVVHDEHDRLIGDCCG